MLARPPVVILCGGRGTRLNAQSGEVPKPLVEIGGRPIVWHVIRLYAAQGFEHFVLATGYRGELIERFAAGERWPEGVRVQVLDTGADTNTGGRVLAAARELSEEPRLCVTYSDGLADIDLGELVGFHRAHEAPATVTVVRPRLQFGVARLDVHDRVLALRGEATLRALDQRRLLLLRARLPGARWRPTACSSASRWRGWRPPGSCAPSATAASGSAWTRSRTRSP